MPAYFQGLAIGLAYVAPIGMQNLFVINTALTQPRRRALLTALIVIFFDITLALFCFFGIGTVGAVRRHHRHSHRRGTHPGGAHPGPVGGGRPSSEGRGGEGLRGHLV